MYTTTIYEYQGSTFIDTSTTKNNNFYEPMINHNEQMIPSFSPRIFENSDLSLPYTINEELSDEQKNEIFSRFFDNYTENMKSLDPEIEKAMNENFWDLVD